MTKSNEDYKKEYQELVKKFWELQKVEQTTEEKAYEEKLALLNQLTASWREQLSKVEGEAFDLANRVTDFDEVKERYDFLRKRYQMLKELDRSL